MKDVSWVQMNQSNIQQQKQLHLKSKITFNYLSNKKICLQVLPTYFVKHYTFRLLDADIVGTENKT